MKLDGVMSATRESCSPVSLCTYARVFLQAGVQFYALLAGMSITIATFRCMAGLVRYVEAIMTTRPSRIAGKASSKLVGLAEAVALAA